MDTPDASASIRRASIQAGFAEFLHPIISGRARPRQHLILPRNRQIVHTVHHLFDLFVLSNPALLSAV
jgi:hypothetical protein